MEKIINLLINNWTKGVDTYTHNGSTWLIFSESKQWVIELTKSKTLWYNYSFFKEVFSLTSMDVVDNQHYITKWVEDNLINVPKCTEPVEHTRNAMTKDTIKYGVKDTILEKNITEGEVDDIIQDGVRHTTWGSEMNDLFVEDTIENGIIEKRVTENSLLFVKMKIDCENVIENGVKETSYHGFEQQNIVEDTIKNGVKETFNFDEKHDLSYEQGVKKLVEDVIKDGVKETNWFEGSMLSVVDNVIDDGINHTEIGWHQCNNVDDVIEKGVIETKGDASQNPMGKVTKVIKNGVKESIAAGYKDPNSRLVYVKWPDEIDEVLENGVKETKTPSNGDIVSFAEWMKENNSTSYPKLIDDVIENGIKETLVSGSWNNDKMDEVIENGKLVSGTFVGGKRQKEDVESVIGYGTKNPSV